MAENSCHSTEENPLVKDILCEACKKTSGIIRVCKKWRRSEVFFWRWHICIYIFNKKYKHEKYITLNDLHSRSSLFIYCANVCYLLTVRLVWFNTGTLPRPKNMYTIQRSDFATNKTGDQKPPPKKKNFFKQKPTDITKSSIICKCDET